MRRLIRLVPATLCLVAIAGCGSSGDSSESSGGVPTARATTPQAPPGASAKSCGGMTVEGAEQVRATGVGCDTARRVVAAWASDEACSTPTGESRYSCSVDGYRCLGAMSEHRIAVSCARQGSSVSFLARRG